MVEKWIHRSLDAAGDVNQATSVDVFVQDPTPEQHLIKAIRGWREFVERLAGSHSLAGFFAALRVCGVDIQHDEAVRNWCDTSLTHLRKSLDKPGYVRVDDAQQELKEIRDEWRALIDKDSDEGRKWKEDIDALRREASAFQQGIEHDEHLRNLLRAHTKLGEDIESTLLVAAGSGAQGLAERAPWFWQDMFNVYLPKFATAVKDIPIPRYGPFSSYAIETDIL